MLIRSKDEKRICNFGVGCAIEILSEEDDNDYLICTTYCENDYDLGYYATEERAVKILNEIADAVHIGKSIYYMPKEDAK